MSVGAMIDFKNFKSWINDNKSYSAKTKCDIVSRLKRADSILKWYDDRVYVYYLEQSEEFKKLPSAIRSQIKKAVKLYYLATTTDTSLKKYIFYLIYLASFLILYTFAVMLLYYV